LLVLVTAGDGDTSCPSLSFFLFLSSWGISEPLGGISAQKHLQVGHLEMLS
jgi:hypothetical protein